MSNSRAEGERMRPSRHAVRTLIAAVSLLLATLLGAECASAQVAPQGARAATAASAPQAPVVQSSGSAEDDCRPRHRARQSVSVPASTMLPAHVCGCDFRTGQAHPDAKSVTVRQLPAVARSAGLTLLHRTLRC